MTSLSGQDYLVELLEQEQIPFQWREGFSKGFKNNPFVPFDFWAESQYNELGGQGDWRQLCKPGFKVIQLHKKILLFDHELSFHRYRQKTFASPLYEKSFDGFDVGQFRSFCRMHEKECLKAGLKPGTWSSPLAEQHFGKADEPGDFYKLGSPGWKLKAFQDFLVDLIAVHEGLVPVRIALYDKIMASRTLHRLEKFWGSRQKTAQNVLIAYIKRRLGMLIQPIR